MRLMAIGAGDDGVGDDEIAGAQRMIERPRQPEADHGGEAFFLKLVEIGAQLDDICAAAQDDHSFAGDTGGLAFHAGDDENGALRRNSGRLAATALKQRHEGSPVRERWLLLPRKKGEVNGQQGRPLSPP
ncbi:hypothetical protein LMG27198_09460 [Methylocystis echinoides]|uniref:Uncharacterized protein n=1 Tax=Methylocystis echinoides TaxID=29468 RepID=A0A9W6GS79_9HYPH|nr:hypothetical protein LMG27198_09460 [Methylocystis echinoides]